MALALDQLGKTAQERETLKKAISLDSTLARAHNQLGLLCLQAGQQTEAETELKAAITLDPGYAAAQNNLGVLYGQQRKNKEAEELFRQATENNPQCTQAFINLGLILAGEAIQLIEAAVAPPKRISWERRRFLVHDEISSRLQLKSGDHSTLDRPGTGMRAKSREVSRCCIRAFQAADNGRWLCERDRQNVHADGLQIQ